MNGWEIPEVVELPNGEVIDTGYGFIDNNGIEVCTDNELFEVD